MNFTVLAVGPWYPATAFTFFAEAFARIGCRVIRVGPSYFTHMGLDWGRDDCPTVDLQFTRERPEWNLPEVVDWCTRYASAPDLLFCSEENYQTDIIPETRIPSVLWSADSWPENYAREALWQPTLAYCNQPRGNAIHPQAETPKPWRFLPGAAAPWLHRNLHMERNVDFTLFATMYCKRPELCAKLAERGCTVISGQRALREYVIGYNVSLATYHNPGWWECKWRWFEAAAMGCINISEYSPLLTQLGYLEHEHYLPVATEFAPEFGDRWPTVESLAESITWLRSNKNRAQEIADNAWRVTLLHHTYYNRIYRIFSDLGLDDLAERAEEATKTCLLK